MLHLELLPDTLNHQLLRTPLNIPRIVPLDIRQEPVHTAHLGTTPRWLLPQTTILSHLTQITVTSPGTLHSRETVWGRCPCFPSLFFAGGINDNANTGLRIRSPSHNANHSSASNYPLSTTSPYTTQNPYSSVQYTSSSASRSRDDTTDRHGNYVETPTTNGSGEPDLNGLAANLDNLSLGRTNDRQAPRRRRMSSNNYGNGHGSSQHGYGAQNVGWESETWNGFFG